MIRIVFFATPEIAVKSLDFLCNNSDVSVEAVVTQPDRPSGRGNKISFSPIKEYALKHDIKLFQTDNLKKSFEVIEKLKQLNPDFFVTFAFGQILSQEVLDIPKISTINLHASLLPKYRGANPIQRVLINGECETGICTMITEKGLDCGSICLKEKIKISKNMNFADLKDNISIMSPELILETLKGLYNGTLKTIPQNSDDATFALKLSKDECLIDWNDTSEKIHNLVRGLYKSPCAYFIHNNKQVKVLVTEISDMKSDSLCGEIIGKDKEGITIKTGNGAIKLIRVKPEGKGEMSAKDWSNGLRGEKL